MIISNDEAGLGVQPRAVSYSGAREQHGSGIAQRMSAWASAVVACPLAGSTSAFCAACAGGSVLACRGFGMAISPQPGVVTRRAGEPRLLETQQDAQPVLHLRQCRGGNGPQASDQPLRSD